MKTRKNRFGAILTYSDYHPTRTTALTDGLLALAKQHDVGVINGSPLAHGLLNSRNPEQENELLGMRQTPADVASAMRLYDQA